MGLQRCLLAIACLLLGAHSNEVVESPVSKTEALGLMQKSMKEKKVYLKDTKQTLQSAEEEGTKEVIENQETASTLDGKVEVEDAEQSMQRMEEEINANHASLGQGDLGLSMRQQQAVGSHTEETDNELGNDHGKSLTWEPEDGRLQSTKTQEEPEAMELEEEEDEKAALEEIARSVTDRYGGTCRRRDVMDQGGVDNPESCVVSGKFRRVKGNCEVDNVARCVSSSNFPNKYNNKELCVILVGEHMGDLAFTSFDAEVDAETGANKGDLFTWEPLQQGQDQTFYGSVRRREDSKLGRGDKIAPITNTKLYNEIRLSAQLGGDIFWTTDSNSRGNGWKLCQKTVPTTAPTSAPTPAPGRCWQTYLNDSMVGGPARRHWAPANGWKVDAGNCSVDDCCMYSPNYPEEYNNADQCCIQTGKDFEAELNAVDFHTAERDDKLIMPVDFKSPRRRKWSPPGPRYRVNHGPNDLPISGDSVFFWTTDGSISSKGWKICKKDCPKPTPEPTPSPTPESTPEPTAEPTTEPTTPTTTTTTTTTATTKPTTATTTQGPTEMPPVPSPTPSPTPESTPEPTAEPTTEPTTTPTPTTPTTKPTATTKPTTATTTQGPTEMPSPCAPVPAPTPKPIKCCVPECVPCPTPRPPESPGSNCSEIPDPLAKHSCFIAELLPAGTEITVLSSVYLQVMSPLGLRPLHPPSR